MNQVYRIVWSSSLGVFQVVSELATARGGKSAGGARNKVRSRITMAAAVTAFATASNAAMATIIVGGTPVSPGTPASGTNWTWDGASLVTGTGTISGTQMGFYNYRGSIDSITNNGTISGSLVAFEDSNGTIGTLTNNGLIGGGNIGVGEGGTITVLNNYGTITGTQIGIDNGYVAPAPIVTLNNAGTISGGRTGIYNGNSDTIGTIINSGTITGATYAIYSEAGATLGTITNSGTIAGNITNLASSDLDINGGSGSTFGILTGNDGAVGQINNAASNVVFASGNLVLNDNVNVGTHTVNNVGATLQVNSTVTITGDYAQAAGAGLILGVSTPSNYAQLVVTGNASIASGSSVSLKSPAYVFATGQRYVVVDAAGSGSYNEDNLHYSATGYSGKIVGQNVMVDGHSDLVLNLEGGSSGTSSGVATNPLATTPNSIAALNGLSHYAGYSPGLLNLQNAVVASNASGSTSEANHVGAQLAPSHSAAGTQAAAAPTFDVLAVVAAHADSLRLAQSDDGSVSRSGIATGDGAPQSGVWGQGFGGHAGQGAVDQVDGYSANYGGILIGADRAINERWRAGGVFSYSNTLISGTENSAGQSTRVNGYGLVGYASYAGTPWYVNLSAGAVQQRFDTSRTIDLTGFSSTASGQFSGQQYVASIEGGYPLDVRGFTLTPIGSLMYSYQHQDGYTESGGSGAALSVGATHSTSVRSALGAKLERGVETAYGVVVPDLQLKWIHEYDHAKASTGASFAADPTGQTAFTTVGAAPVSDLADMSVGVTVLRASNLTLTARFEVQAGSRFVSETGSLRLRQLF